MTRSGLAAAREAGDEPLNEPFHDPRSATVSNEVSDVTATSLPCPPWCAMRPGHGFDSTSWEGNLARVHSRTIGDGYASVDLVQLETAAGPGGPVDKSEPPDLTVWIGGESCDKPLSGAQARELAVLLVRAADVWETTR